MEIKARVHRHNGKWFVDVYECHRNGAVTVIKKWTTREGMATRDAAIAYADDCVGLERLRMVNA